MVLSVVQLKQSSLSLPCTKTLYKSSDRAHLRSCSGTPCDVAPRCAQQPQHRESRAVSAVSVPAGNVRVPRVFDRVLLLSKGSASKTGAFLILTSGCT